MRYGIYVRISRDPTGREAGVERQERECREYAERHGLDIHGVYSDNDISAYTGTHRPGWERLLKDVENGTINGILGWHTDRFYRRTIELDRLIELTKETGLEIRTVHAGHFDLSNPTGRMVAHILAAVAQQEVGHNAERLRASHYSRALKGEWRTGTPPYGYVNDGPGRIAIDPEKGAVVREIVDGILQGKTLLRICRELNDRGVTTNSGGKWENVYAKRVALSPTIAGLSTYKDEIVGEGNWEPIITVDERERLKAILNDPTRGKYQGKERVVQGSGVYVCDVCGSGLKTNKTRGKGRERKRVYQCPNNHLRIMQEPIDHAVDLAVMNRIKALAAEHSAKADDDPALHDLIEERKQLESRHTRLGELFATGQITEKQLVSGTTSIEKKLQPLNSKITELAGGTLPDDWHTAEIMVKGFYLTRDPDRKAKLIRHLLSVRVKRVGPGFRGEPAERLIIEPKF